ncbi:TolC family protein [Enterobacter mori]|uniref:TolC family protein n=1 Tax=Enterobacter mori TaxID=539813 RepID=UPI001B8D4A0B|nr:TolC family protein [Enterobacter mori]MBS3049712.1 TolC family protein [Enterobacter mori]
MAGVMLMYLPSLLFIFLLTIVGIVQAETRVPATLSELLRFAEKQNAITPEKLSQLPSLEGQKKTADALLFNNPELSYSNGIRKSLPGNPEQVDQREWDVGLSQTFEIAGQQGHRQRVAEFALNSYKSEVQDAQNQVQLRTSILFYQLLMLQEKVRLETEAVAIFTRAEAIIDKQRKDGGATRLENNLASIERQLAMNEQLLATQALAEAKGELARLLLTATDNIPAMSGKLDNIKQKTPYTFALLNKKLNDAPAITAQTWKEKQAQANLMLQKAARIPDISIGVNYANDGSANRRENLSTISLSVPLPLFQRNETEIGMAAADLSLSQVALKTLRNDQEQMLKILWDRMESLKARILVLNTQMVPLVEFNKQLTVRSREYGEIGIPAELLASQQAINAYRSRLNILMEYHITRLTLENIAGWKDAS